MNKLHETRHNIIKSEKCWICGKSFRVIVRKKDGKILSKCFHGELHKYYLNFWCYQLNKNKKGKIILTPVFKNNLWKVLAYTKLQRWIISNIWDLFYERKRISYWECPDCANRKDD